MKTLYLAWQAPDPARAWFPIGRLDAEPENHHYRFRYTGGALEAQQKAGLRPLIAFPKFDADYESAELFPLFQNRILSPSRKDFPTYLNWLDLSPEMADPIEILARSGGERATDNLHVFPQIIKDANNNFRTKFFLHGLRHLGEDAFDRAKKLKMGEDLKVMVELNNPVTSLAVTLHAEDYQMVGWAPRYLVKDLLASVVEAPKLRARVARINLDAAPLNRRVIIEIEGTLPADHKPMATPDFSPLIA